MESGENFRNIVDNADEMIVIAQDNLLKYVNRRTLTMLGMSEAELLSRPFLEFIHPEDRPMVAANYGNRIRGEPAPARYPFRVVTAGGRARWVELNAIRLEWEGRPSTLNFLTDIDDRRRADEALQESERKYRLLTESLRDVVSTFDTQTLRYTYVSPSIRELRGYTAEEILAGEAALTPEELERRRSLLPGRVAEYLSGRAPRDGQYMDEIRQIRKDGSPVWTEVVSSHFRDERTGHVTILAVTRDVTERRKAETALRRNQARLVRAERISKIGSWEILLDPGLVTASPGACAIYGIAEETIPLESAKGLALPEFRQMLDAALSDLVSRGAPYDVEYRIRRADDGSVRDIHAAAEYDAVSRTVHGVIRDVTERNRDRESLRSSEERFRRMFTHSASGMATVSPDFRFLQANPAFCRMLGYPEEELRERTFQDVTYQGDKAAWTEWIGKLLRGERESFHMEKRCVRKDGSILWVLVNTTLLRDSGNRPIHFIAQIQDITERRQAEENLRESEEKYRLLHENAGIGIGYYRPDGTVISYNKVAAGHMGGKPEDFAGKSVFALFPPADAAFYLDRIGKAAGSEVPMVYDDMVPLPTGDLHFLSTFTRILNSGGDVFGIQIISQDVTQLKNTQKELRKSRMLLNATIESIQGSYISAVDRDFRYLYFNDAHRRRMREVYKADIAVGLSLLDCIPVEDDRRSVRERFGKALAGGHFAITRAYNDESTTYHNSFNPILNEDGDVIGATGFSIDITKQVEAERELKKSQMLLESIIDTIRGASISCIDGNYDYLYCNATHREWMKRIYGADVRVGGNLFDCITMEEDKAETEAHFSRAFRGESFTIGRRYRNSPSYHENSFSPIRDGHDRIIGVTAFSLDVTDRVSAENEKRKSDQYLQQVQKLESLGVLAGGIAHDFNNILTGVFGYIDLARTRERDPSVSECLALAMRNMDRARSLTQQLLTFSRGGAPVRKVASILPLVRETAAFAASGSSVRCLFDLPEDLWQCSVDRQQIGQVIQNLALNAVQAMPLGGEISVAARNVALQEREIPALDKGPYVRISVKDHGIGMSPEMMRRIFEPFFTTKEMGHGLGLAIAYSIVKRHGGAIHADSQPGKGSVFHVYLPASTERAGEDAGGRRARHAGSGRILVMDDEEPLRRLVSAMLESFGYSAVGAADGKEAVERFRGETALGNAFKGMILDLTVPGGMGGRQAAEEIRKLDGNVPIFVASGYAEDPILADPARFGFSGSISKPFSMDELAKLLEGQWGTGSPDAGEARA